MLVVPCIYGVPALTTLVSFTGTNGANPKSGLIQGSDGYLYGTTVSGGDGGYGTIFRMTLSGSLTNLASFNKTNGNAPQAGLVLGADGNFYGTAYYGGTSNLGTIFKLTSDDTLTAVVSFANTNGADPVAGLVAALDGNIYGTTANGGISNVGTAFQLSTNGLLDTLYSFGQGNNDGYSPYGNLIQVKDGSFYGTTYLGGTNNQGTLFKLMTNGAYTNLYSFTGANDGALPYAGLVQGADGNLYGTTFAGGSNGFGTAYKLTTNGAFSTLLSFDNTNGAFPQAALLPGADGSLYGTTSYGGATNAAGNSYGTIFKLLANGTLSTLFSFDNTNGANPQAPLALGTDGSLYGTTANGGVSNSGTVFRFSLLPPAPPVFKNIAKTGGSLTLTWSALAWRNYQFQYKTNLNQANWNNLGGVITATNTIMTTLDSTGPDPKRFYQILLLP